MNRFIELIQEFFTSVFKFNIFIGIIAAVVVFVFEIKYMNKHKRVNKKLEKARQLKNVVTAKRINTWSDNPHGTSMDSWVYATYTYEVDGKCYKYKYMERQIAPITLELYYINNPRKVFTSKEKSNLFASLLFYILPIATAIIVIFLLGGV